MTGGSAVERLYAVVMVDIDGEVCGERSASMLDRI